MCSCSFILHADTFVLLFTVNGKSIGRAMYEMQLQFGSEWSFMPDIYKPTDTPLEKEIKMVIKRMIQPLPYDRISMAEVVSKFAELRSQYKPDVKPQDTSSSGNIRPSASRGNSFYLVTIVMLDAEKQGPLYVDSISYNNSFKNGDSHYMRGLNIYLERNFL